MSLGTTQPAHLYLAVLVIPVNGVTDCVGAEGVRAGLDSAEIGGHLDRM